MILSILHFTKEIHESTSMCNNSVNLSLLYRVLLNKCLNKMCVVNVNAYTKIVKEIILSHATSAFKICKIYHRTNTG